MFFVDLRNFGGNFLVQFLILFLPIGTKKSIANNKSKCVCHADGLAGNGGIRICRANACATLRSKKKDLKIEQNKKCCMSAER